MIRKSGNRFSLATNAERVCAEIMLKQSDAIMMRFYVFASDLEPDLIPSEPEKL